MTLKIEIISDDLPPMQLSSEVMQGFETGIYYPQEAEIDLYKYDLETSICKLVNSIGVFETLAIIATEFKRVSGMELKI